MQGCHRADLLLIRVAPQLAHDFRKTSLRSFCEASLPYLAVRRRAVMVQTQHFAG